MAENLTAVRFFHHASSGEGIVKIPSRACATARNVWSSQDVKITKIAICQDQARKVAPKALLSCQAVGIRGPLECCCHDSTVPSRLKSGGQSRLEKHHSGWSQLLRIWQDMKLENSLGKQETSEIQWLKLYCNQYDIILISDFPSLSYPFLAC